MYKRLRHPVLDRSTSDVYYKIKEQLRDQLRCNSNAVTRSSSLMQLRAALAMRLLSAQARALLAAATYAGTYLYLWKLKVRWWSPRVDVMLLFLQVLYVVYYIFMAGCGWLGRVERGALCLLSSALQYADRGVC